MGDTFYNTVITKTNRIKPKKPKVAQYIYRKAKKKFHKHAKGKWREWLKTIEARRLDHFIDECIQHARQCQKIADPDWLRPGDERLDPEVMEAIKEAEKREKVKVRRSFFCIR